MKQLSSFSWAVVLAVTPAAAAAEVPANPLVERIAPDRLKLSWTARSGVDVFMTDRPDATADSSTLLSADDRDGSEEVKVAPGSRPYFLLRDRSDGANVRVAERAVPLEHGSNVRDIGGYPAAGGKHVRWGKIFRSGATAMLTQADQNSVAGLHLANMIDLRSEEERQLAPLKIYGVPYHAVGYSISALMAQKSPSESSIHAVPSNGAAMYRQMPKILAPQMRVLFDRLRANEGPIVYNCSAGQDRTGFATALILSALGVPRDVIIADYHLSTHYRRPEYELPPFDPAAFPNNAAARMFGHYRNDPDAAKPQPLKEADGTAFLTFALDAIDQHYGSVENYLAKEAGVNAIDIAALRTNYLE